MAHRLLQRDNRLPPERKELRWLLGAGPAIWPETGSPELARAREVSGRETPPAPAPGVTVLLADNAKERRGSVWLLYPALPEGCALSKPRFETQARQAWTEALVAVQRSVPVLWRSVQTIGSAGPAACFLGQVYGASEPGRLNRPEPELEGRSFGLSFALAIASRLFGHPVPADLAASAELLSSGEVAGVQRLDRKLEALSATCPRVRRLLVAESDVASARGIVERLDAPIEVVGVRSLRDALRVVFPDPETLVTQAVFPTADGGLSEQVARLPAEDQPDLAATFFRLATGPREAVLEWRPLARAAETMLERWPELSEETRDRLVLAQAIALRHANNEGPFALVRQLVDDEPRLLVTAPEPQRTELVAQLVQQAADAVCEEGDVERALELAERHLVRGSAAFCAHLKVLGALGRLRAVTGAPEQAIELQREATLGWLKRGQEAGASTPLSEWLRLAGVLQLPEQLAAAEAARARVELWGGLANPVSRAYVALAGARGRIALEADPEQLRAALAPLERLAGDTTIPAQLRAGAVDWWARACRRLGDEDAAHQPLRTLETFASRQDVLGEKARRAIQLLRLDAAVRAHDEEGARAPLAWLQKHQRGPTGHLLRAATELGRDPPAYVSRFFPY